MRHDQRALWLVEAVATVGRVAEEEEGVGGLPFAVVVEIAGGDSRK